MGGLRTKKTTQYGDMNQDKEGILNRLDGAKRGAPNLGCLLRTY